MSSIIQSVESEMLAENSVVASSLDTNEEVYSDDSEHDESVSASLSNDEPIAKNVVEHKPEETPEQFLIKPKRMGIALAFGKGYQTTQRDTINTFNQFQWNQKIDEIQMQKPSESILQLKPTHDDTNNNKSTSKDNSNPFDNKTSVKKILDQEKERTVKVTKSLFAQYDQLLRNSVQKVQAYEKTTKINLIDWSELEFNVDHMGKIHHIRHNLKNVDLTRSSVDKSAFIHQANSSAQWFTNQPLSPKSVESHDSFWDEIADSIEHTSPVINKLINFEDQIHAKLCSEINGKWTKRFVSKRTKPKILNSLHRERLDVLIHFLNKDSNSWKVSKSAYVNLAFRTRLNYDSVDQWRKLIQVFGEFNFQTEQFIRQEHIAFDRFVSWVPSGTNIQVSPHLKLFSNIVNALFARCTVSSQQKRITTVYDQKRTEVSLTENQIMAEISENENNVKSNPEQAVQKLTERALKRREKMHEKDQIKLESYTKPGNQTVSGSDTASIRSYSTSSTSVDVIQALLEKNENLEKLQQFLQEAGNRLNDPFWKLHDTYHMIDDEIDTKINEALVYFGNNADHNPLIKTNVKIFPKFLNETLTLIRSSNYAKRRMNCIVSALLPDFMTSEISSANVMCESIKEFMETQMSKLNSSEAIENQIKTLLAESVAHSSDTQNSGVINSLQVCHNTLSDMSNDTNDLIEDEIPQVSQLTNSQILCQSDMLVIGADFIKKHDPMSAFQFPCQGSTDQGQLFLEFLDQIGDNTYAYEDSGLKDQQSSTHLPQKVLEMKNAQIIATMMVQNVQPRQASVVLTEQKWLFIFENKADIEQQNQLIPNEFDQLNSKRVKNKNVRFNINQNTYKSSKQKEFENDYELNNQVLESHEQFQSQHDLINVGNFESEETEQVTFAINLNRLSNVHVNSEQRLIILGSDTELMSFGVENEETLENWKKQLRRLCFHV